jgi:hypothetical protein
MDHKCINDENKNMMNINNAITKLISTKPESLGKKEINEMLMLQQLFDYSVGNIIPSKDDNNEISEQWKEFKDIIKDIVASQDSNYLQGNLNIIEQLISKYGNVPVGNLPDLKKITMKLEKGFGMLNEFGEHLPILEELNLQGSQFKMISEIGSSFSHLIILNVSYCGIRDLSGIINIHITVI